MFSLQLLLSSVFFIGILKFTSADQYKIVETNLGKVRGLQNVTLFKQTPYFSFKGIPYAKAPIGDLRLKAPEPAAAWAPKTIDAFKHGKICPQASFLITDTHAQSEDCLSLNIYVPADIKSNEKLAVLFFIHGGGFVMGSGNDFFYGPDFIIEKRTILVTINYRVGILGFLSLGLPEYSGNMGLKDQQLALKWISENIDNFGGDNKRITISGQSAGGASVHYQILSEESRKYFRNAIPMSGTVDDIWTMSQEKDHITLAHQIASELGHEVKTNDDLVEFFKSIPATKLFKFSAVPIENSLLVIPISPIIERKNAKQPFITETPAEIYDKSNIDVDVLFTVTSLEMAGIFSKIPTFDEFKANFDLPFKNLKSAVSKETYQRLIDDVRKFYYGTDEIYEQSLLQYFNLISDMNFFYGIAKSTRMNADKSKGKTFFLTFSADTKLNAFKYINDPEMSNFPGATHGDDLLYAFRVNWMQSLYDDILSESSDELNQAALRTIDYITEIIANFAKNGDPSCEGGKFHAVKKNAVHFLDINNDGLVAGLGPNENAVEFWSQLEQRVQQLLDESLNAKRDEF